MRTLATICVVLAAVLFVTAAYAAATDLPTMPPGDNFSLYAIMFIAYQTLATLGSYFKTRADNNNGVAQLEMRLQGFINEKLKGLEIASTALTSLTATAVTKSECEAYRKEADCKLAAHDTAIEVLESKAATDEAAAIAVAAAATATKAPKKRVRRAA